MSETQFSTQEMFNQHVAGELGSLSSKMDVVLERTAKINTIALQVDRNANELKIYRWVGGTLVSAILSFVTAKWKALAHLGS